MCPERYEEDTLRNKIRAIVIDDMTSCREFLVELLESRGYQVQSYPDLSAHPLCKAPESGCPTPLACPDVLLLDNRMPYMSGLEFLERQRRNGCRLDSKAKAIFSGSWSTEELQQAGQLGCRVFSKPFSVKIVEDWLEELETQLCFNRESTELDRICGWPHPRRDNRYT